MDPFKNRKLIIQGIVLLTFFVFSFKLFHLQLLDESYKDLASQNIVRRIKLYPTRGMIYDRNNKLIVTNDAVYDLYVVPRQIQDDLDTLKFCKLLGLDVDFFEKQLKKATNYSKVRPSLFLKQISIEEYANFQEHLYQFPGFYSQIRTIRRYPYGVGTHFLGYIGEVDPATVQASDYYESGDYIGINGLEKVYEKQLRGERGSRYILVDVFNREKGSFRDGEMDTFAVRGKSLKTSVDIDLQLYGELLMQNKKGSIVAIEPSTGEILAYVSSPSFDPNLLSGRHRGENFQALALDTLGPLFNRPIMAWQHPPGSTFKPLMALMGLSEGTLKTTDRYKCHPGYYLGSFSVGCHNHATVHNLAEAIQHSCNAYFCNVFRNVIDQDKFSSIQESLSHWDEYLYSFGLGSKLGVDLPNEEDGQVPTPELYNNMYHNERWKSTTIISLGIGQGELGITPLQLANMTATIANRGFYYTPHFATKIEDSDTLDILKKFQTPHYSLVKKDVFEPVIEGMYRVIEKGTGRRAKTEGIEMCGKTGTAQNPNGEDHSVFIAFAPKDNPKIAISVFVENAGGGSRYAAPIAGLMIEKYLNDTISNASLWKQEMMLESNLIAYHEEE